MHSCLPLDEILFRNFPAEQSIHVVCELAPDCIEYFPSTQLVQLDSELAANTVEYFPSTQLIQLASDIAANTVEYFPSTQLVQLASELAVNVVEYVPAKHWEHVPPFAPVNPALHWHAVFIILPAKETEFAGQFVQVADPSPDLN